MIIHRVTNYCYTCGVRADCEAFTDHYETDTGHSVEYYVYSCPVYKSLPWYKRLFTHHCVTTCVCAFQ